MRTRQRSDSRRSALKQAPWLWEGAGYFLAIAVVGTELVARITFVVLH